VVLQAPTSEAVKCQAVVDALSTHLSPHVTLEHIQGPDLAAHDTMALKNLLDIFSVLFHLPSADEERESSYGELSEADDSNIISTKGRYNLPMPVHSQRSLVAGFPGWFIPFLCRFQLHEWFGAQWGQEPLCS